MEFLVKSDPNLIKFTLNNHPTIKGLAVVQYPGGTANYDKVDIEHYFDTGMWIKIEN